MILAATAVESVVTAVLSLIKARLEFDAKMFDALPPEDRIKAAKEHYASISLLHENQRNFHAVLIAVFELVGGKSLVPVKG